MTDKPNIWGIQFQRTRSLLYPTRQLRLYFVSGKHEYITHKPV